MNGREEVNGHVLLTACLSRRGRGHQRHQLNARHGELLRQSPGGPQGPKVSTGCKSNGEIKSREAPGCWKGWEPAGAGGSAGRWARAGERAHPLPATVPCCDTSGEEVAHPRSCREFRGGPGSSARPRSISDPQSQGCTWGGGLFPKALGRTHSSLPKRTSGFPGAGRGSHQSPHVSGEIHARCAGTSSLHDTRLNGACPPCSPTQDRVADGERGLYRGKPGPCPPRPRSPRPQPAARGHAWPARRVSTGSAQPRRGALTSVTNTPAPAKAGLPGQAEN